MDHIGIVKRAFQQTLRHKAMWLFGFLLALTGAKTAGRGGGGGGSGGEPVAPFGIGPSAMPGGTSAVPILLIVLFVILLILFLALIFTVIRYVSEAGLVGMTREAEETGETSVRQGFRFGWSRSAWRLFLMDLLIWVPTVLIFLALLALALSPLLLLTMENRGLAILGVAGTAGTVLLVIGLLVVVSIALSLLREFFVRKCVLEGMGVLDSIREGFGFVRRHLKDVFVMWLLMVGIGILWGFIIFALVVLLGMLAVVVGGVPAYLLASATDWGILGALLLVAAGIVLVALPMILVTALFVTFQYNVWTLTYLDLSRAEAVPATQ